MYNSTILEMKLLYGISIINEFEFRNGVIEISSIQATEGGGHTMFPWAMDVVGRPIIWTTDGSFDISYCFIEASYRYSVYTFNYQLSTMK